MIVRHLVRNVIQTGVLAAIWAIASLASWFFVDRILIYRLFDITSGTVYTYVSDPPAARLSSKVEHLGNI